MSSSKAEQIAHSRAPAGIAESKKMFFGASLVKGWSSCTYLELMQAAKVGSKIYINKIRWSASKNFYLQ
jgi:hypothetical protein